MDRIEKTVFLSYRRTNIPWALAIFQNLTNHRYDVFFDYQGLSSGDFEQVILANIAARAHFLVLLTPSALERCQEPSDWLRREIETALAHQRNIVPLLLEGFSFSTPSIAAQLTGKLSGLSRYNGLTIPQEYFEEAMHRLRDRYLNVPLNAVLHPPPLAAQRAAARQKRKAKAAAAVGQNDLSAQQWFERGCSAADPNEQVRSFDEALRLKPDFVDALLYRGNAHLAKSDFDAAMADYNAALLLRPHDAEAFNGRGLVHFNRGELESAIADYDRALRLKPDAGYMFNNRGVARHQLGLLDAAIADYTESIRLRPNHANTFSNRAAARYAKGDTKAANDDMKQADHLRTSAGN